MNIPKIRIQYGRFLDPLLKKLIILDNDFFDKFYPEEGDIVKQVIEYKTYVEENIYYILDQVCARLDLKFSQNYIDVYVVGRQYNPFSNPMVIACSFIPGRFVTPENFFDVLIHECLHRILTDNDKQVPVREIWSKMFPDEQLLVRNHVILHALHKWIYIDVMKKTDRFDNDYKRSQNYPAYKKSWQIVENRGYNELIEEFKRQYIK
jgi:hypothetical protein